MKQSGINHYFLGSLVFIFVLFLLATTGFSNGHNNGNNFADIISPQMSQTIDYHPVEIIIEFKDGAKPETFKAWLNRNDITDQFEPTEGGMRALVGPENGLRYRLIEESNSHKKIGHGLNVLKTKINGIKRKNDIDICLFEVAYNPVQTTRDDKGIWYITGGSLYDVFEAYGYAVASDRLWQIELYRRQAQGRLSEAFGSGFLNTDIFMRTYGYSDDEYQSHIAALDFQDPEKSRYGNVLNMGFTVHVCSVFL